MAKLIFKCPHFKSGVSHAAHLSNYIRYAATRENAERIDPGRAGQPATVKQRELVERLIRDFPMSKGLEEYADYQQRPTQETATAFISSVIDQNIDKVAKLENYVDYIANRPLAQHIGSHALFTGGDGSVVLSKVAEEVSNHPGVVWMPIISLRREDAARLGYDNAERWKKLLSHRAPYIAEAMKIPLKEFRWYAAFHDEGHHPHIHMIVYSADGKSGFLTKKGIEKIRGELTNEIFQQDLVCIYKEQTARRDRLAEEARARMEELVKAMQRGTLNNSRIEELTMQLARGLRRTKGKKQYGYLSKGLKSIVDQITDELANDPRVAEAYDLWNEMREEVLLTYKGKSKLPPRLPLSQQKEFKHIRNMIVQEAVKLEPLVAEMEPMVEPPLPDVDSNVMYRRAKQIFDADDTTPEQVKEAVELLTEAAGDGYDLAQYALGKCYRDGVGVEKDVLKAVIWFTEAAERGNSYAAYALGKLYLTGEDAPKNINAALRWLERSVDGGNQFAQYTLGRLFLDGKDVPKDIERATMLLTASADQGNPYAKQLLDHRRELNGPTLFQSATKLLRQLGTIFQAQMPHDDSGALHSHIDSKTLTKIRAKKIAMGHKPDDHEDQGWGMGGMS